MAARHDVVPLMVGPGVSAARLANSPLPALSELEFALTMSNHAVQWRRVRCMTAAGGPAMSPLRVLIVHLLNRRARPGTLADICQVLNIQDTHLAKDTSKTLAGHGLVTPGRKGRERTIAITPAGTALCSRHAGVRKALVVQAARQAGIAPEALLLSGSCDQAARAAAW